MSGVFDVLTKDLRKTLGCKTGSVNFNSPENKQGVIDLLSEIEGTVEPVIKVTDKNNNTRIIRNQHIAERMKINILGNNLQEEINNSIIEGSKLDNIQYVSNENAKIYERNVAKIVPFIRK